MKQTYFHHVEHSKVQKQSKVTLWATLLITLFFYNCRIYRRNIIQLFSFIVRFLSHVK